MRKSMLLALMLAMVLAVTVPAAAQVINTGNLANEQGTSASVPENSVSGQDALNQDASCYDLIVDQIANNLGITLDEAAELLGFATPEELDVLVAEFCD